MASFIRVATTTAERTSPAQRHTIRLNPTESSFQHPSRATPTLSLEFEGVNQLLSTLSVCDPADQRAAALKISSRKSCGLSRVLGSSCIISIRSESGTDATVVDCVFPFSSFTYTQVEYLHSVLRTHLHGSSSQSVSSVQENSKHAILYRVRENYDDAQGRYLSPWKVLHTTLPFFTSASTVGSEKYRDEDATFSIHWSALQS